MAWRDVPERYGSRVTPHTRFRRRAKDGTFTRLKHLKHLKQWRGITTRCDKTAESYRASVTLASPLMWT
ncbi:hypothetical protein ACIF80_18825 [Streptomyces sp. NPDC085927]|uniref:hypothetical protein n=1 Tax=Streptomyces sp. NPDC085927 TaxID=3365738 RepID=UPI0037D6A713